MTVKISVNLTPIDETAKLTVTQKKAPVDGKEAPPNEEVVETISVMQTKEVSLESGDKLRIEVETGKILVHDADQNVVRLEDPPHAEVQKGAKQKEPVPGPFQQAEEGSHNKKAKA